MNKVTQSINIGSKTVSQDTPAFIIAEIGNNHNGDYSKAKKLVDHAKDAGADAVKFQLRDLVTLFNQNSFESDNLNTEYTIDILKKFQLEDEELFELFEYAISIDILPLCTPWDFVSLEKLAEKKLSAFKIASADLTNHELIKKAAKYKVPLICSTGMSTEEEIIETSQLLNEANGEYIMLHCNSTYPAPLENINLNYMKRIKEITKRPVGYSGHEQGTSVAIAAVALGARVIEKHITLDKNMEGPDHRASLEPDEFKYLVKEIRAVETAMGNKIKKAIGQGELLNRCNLAKSIVAKTEILQGEVITNEMLEVKSPGKGLQPNKIEKLIGQPAKRQMRKGDFFYFSDLQKESLSLEDYKFKLPWGIPVRLYDLKKLSHIIEKADLLEFHLSYKDLDLNPADFIKGQYKHELIVHAPELFEDDHMLDLACTDQTYLETSINCMKRVVEHTIELKRFFPNTSKPKIIVNAGGFSNDGFIEAHLKNKMYQQIATSLNSIKSDDCEFIIQTMPPFPWHFGGRRYHNLFLTPQEITKFCKEHNYRICFDVSHSQLACNYYHLSMEEFAGCVRSYVAHLHIADASGNDREGLQIGDGNMKFASIFKIFEDSDATFIPEIWQGHEDEGYGFIKALNALHAFQ
jgi:sialic acid synthase SpsE/endonuclease IV